MDSINVDVGHNEYVIYVNHDAMATSLAERIVKIHVPAWMSLFLSKNRKYRKVDDHLGARGVFPDINRKVGILEARVWDGDEPLDGSESTVEVIDDLIGHLFLMRDFLVQQDYRDKQPGEPMGFEEPMGEDGYHEADMAAGPWLLNPGLEPLRDEDDGPLFRFPPLGPDNQRGRMDPVDEHGYIVNVGCHPGCPIPVGRLHWHEDGNLDMVHPGPKPPTMHEDEIRKAQSFKISEAVDRMFPRSGS